MLLELRTLCELCAVEVILISDWILSGGVRKVIKIRKVKRLTKSKEEKKRIKGQLYTDLYITGALVPGWLACFSAHLLAYLCDGSYSVQWGPELLIFLIIFIFITKFGVSLPSDRAEHRE